MVAGFDSSNTTLTGLDDSTAYDPFGQATAQSGTDHDLGYQGSWTDPDTDEINMGARWYDSATGTFDSQDPQTYSSGPSILANGYTYAAGDPMDLSDPDGNWPSCGWCSKAASAVSSAVTSAARTVGSAVSSAASYAWHAVTYVASKAVSAVKTAAKYVAKAAAKVYNAGKAAISYVANKVSESASYLREKAAAAAAYAKQRAEAARRAAIAHAKAVTRKAKAVAVEVIKHNPLPAVKALMKPVVGGLKKAIAASAKLPAAVVAVSKTVVGAWGSSWTSQGGSLAGPATGGRFSDGRLVLFGVDSAGALWVQSQAAANGAYGAWGKTSGTDLAEAPTVVTTTAGGLVLFARTTAGAVQVASYSTAGVLSAWTSLRQPSTAALDAKATPSVLVLSDRMRAFVTLADGTVMTKLQDLGGAWTAAWQVVSGLKVAGPVASDVDPEDGTAQVFARSADGNLSWVSEVTKASNTWTTWKILANKIATDPSPLTWNDGTGPFWGLISRISSGDSVIVDFTIADKPPLTTTSGAARNSTTAKPAPSVQASGSDDTKEPVVINRDQPE